MQMDAKAHYERGTMLLESDPEEALKQFDASLLLDPNAPPARYNRIVALASLGRDAEALHDLALLEAVAPHLSKCLREDLRAASVPYADIAQEAFLSKKFEFALSKYNSALSYDDGNASAWAGKGLALSALGLNDEALHCVNRAVQLEENSYFAWTARAKVHFARGELRDALGSYTTAIELWPNDPDAYLARSVVRSELGETDDARQDKEAAERLLSDQL